MATGLLRIPHLPVAGAADRTSSSAGTRRPGRRPAHDSGRGTPAHRAVRSGHGGPASPDHPSPLGRTLGWLFEHVPVVGAFRTTNKVGAVLVLGAALALATAGSVLMMRRTTARWRIVAGLGVVGLVAIAAVHPAVTGRLFTVEYDVPDYWRAAAADIDDADDGSRVWFLPGQSQADYAWTEPIPDDPRQGAARTTVGDSVHPSDSVSAFGQSPSRRRHDAAGAHCATSRAASVCAVPGCGAVAGSP